MKMPTLISDTPPNCLDDPKLLHIRESAKKIVLRAAQFIVGLSSSFGIITSPISSILGIVVETWCFFANICMKLQMVSL
jgi:cytochrome c biogenesis protein CcdA